MLYLRACCKRDQRNWRGREGSMKFTTRLKNFSGKTLNNPLMHSVIFLLTGRTQLCATDTGSLCNIRTRNWQKGRTYSQVFFPYNLYKHILHFTFSQFEVCQTQSSRGELFKLFSFMVIKLLLCPPCLLATTAVLFRTLLVTGRASRNNGA